MNHKPDDQLSKAALKSAAEMLAHFEKQYADLGATIATMRRIVGTSTNGAQPSAPAERDDAVKDVKAVVERAKARFAARKQKQPRRTPSRTPAEWQEAIVAFLAKKGAPATSKEIGKAISNGSSNAFYGHINEAFKAKTIVMAGALPRVGAAKPQALFALAGKGRKLVGTATKPRRGNKVKEQRARSLAILSAFDTTEPRPNPPEHHGKIAKLISHGYLKHKGEGYVRTAKEFVV